MFECQNNIPVIVYNFCGSWFYKEHAHWFVQIRLNFVMEVVEPLKAMGLDFENLQDLENLFVRSPLKESNIEFPTSIWKNYSWCSLLKNKL